MPRIDVVTRIASIFNISIDYLLGFCDDKSIQILNDNSDLNFAVLIRKLYSLESNSHLSKKQIELIKKILLANKEFILSA